ncbi:hypothetical protein ACMHYJ_01395 [Castellaniella hirudinis]|uniref:hypothetical protein n=1 Tax=Castellaniella hirudinis TaxID=1144617 RepID=UPI0039C0B77B
MAYNLFNEDYYLTYNPDVAAAILQGNGLTAEQHFNLFGNAEGRAPGPLFDPQYYLSANPDVADAVLAGLITAYDHFLLYGIPEDRSPLIVFDPDYYLALNPDVAAALGADLNAVQHFLQYGSTETRAISPFIDLAAYLAANPDVAGAVAAGQMTALQHLMNYGVLESRDLGNGIDLAIFQNDASFMDALSAGNYDLALARMAQIAPFLPDFQPPDGWTPAPDTPIPVDFVPPEGSKLVVPPGVVVPDDLLPLPDTFESDHAGGGGSGGGGGGPAFTVTDDGGGLHTLGVLNGDVVITVDGDDYVFTPATGAAVRVPVDDVDGLIVNDITLSGLGPVISGMQITGTGGVVVNRLQDQHDDAGNMNADLSGLSTVQVDAYYDIAGGSTLSQDIRLGTASVWVENSTGEGDLRAYRKADSLDFGASSLHLADNVELIAFGYQLEGAQIQGQGKVSVSRLSADSDFSGLADSLIVTATVSSGSSDVTLNPTLAVVDLFSVQSAATLTLTADQADGRPIAGKGEVTILGAAGDQILTVKTTGEGLSKGTNFIAGGLGADQITLGDGEDIVIVGGARPAVAQETTLSFNTSALGYDVLEPLTVTIEAGGLGPVTISSSIAPLSMEGSLANLAAAINASTALAGVIEPVDDAADFSGGQLTLVAAEDGLAGAFSVTSSASQLEAIEITQCPKDARDVSESPAIDHGWDVITGFTVGQDYLQLEDGYTVVKTGSITVGADSHAISSAGIVADTSSIGELDTVLQALADQLTATSQATVAFEHGGHTYVFQSDGVGGLTTADTLIQLAGVTDLDDLDGILGSSLPPPP